MKGLQRAAAVALVGLYLACLGASCLTRFDYAHQSRDCVAASPSRLHPLGTDDLGRDALARLIHASRI
jgi:ABC-type dipeptide/oligopeptide/nickel transport system permease subunit